MPRKFDDSQTAEFHWKAFEDFARLELETGGPDVHMRLLEHVMADMTEIERVWFIGCYVGPYNVPTAEVFYRYVTPRDAMLHQYCTARWLEDNWQGFVIRKERRPVKSPRQMAEYLASYAAWMQDFDQIRRVATYDELWEKVNEIRYVGRYAALKLCEVLKRYTSIKPGQTDMRPKGGWSPRIGLAYLYPEHKEQLFGNDCKENLVLTNTLGEGVRKYLTHNLGRHIDHFHAEVFLCDYKQAWHGSQFPGKSNDSELQHYLRVQSYWEMPSRLPEARLKLLDHRTLGELHGWSDVRKELGHVLKEHGYTWSDTLYDYKRTVDLAHPVRWGEES